MSNPKGKRLRRKFEEGKQGIEKALTNYEPGDDSKTLPKELEVFKPVLDAAHKKGDEKVLDSVNKLIHLSLVGGSKYVPQTKLLKELPTSMLSALNGDFSGLKNFNHFHNEKIRGAVKFLIDDIEACNTNNASTKVAAPKSAELGL